MARTRKLGPGVTLRRGKLRVAQRVNRKLYTETFAIETPSAELQAWRAEQVERYAGVVPASGSFAADIATYLARIAAMPTRDQKAAHLELWAQALGRDRARRTITPAEIDAVLQGWLLTLAPATVRKRRTSLQSLFVRLDGKLAKNAVKATANPVAPKPEARGLDYLTIEKILAAMPTRRSARPGTDRGLSLSKVRAAVLAYTGLPPGQLQTVTPTDLQLTAATVRVHARRKGRGTAPSTRPLTVEGVAAFKAFHACDAYGRFATESVNRAFKRAAKRIGIDPATVHLYDLRHSFGMELYRVTRDLATVGRFLGHAPGSVVTARYAQGADAAVDLAAAQAFSDALAAQRQLSLKTARQLPAKVTRAGKSSEVKQFRKRA